MNRELNLDFVQEVFIKLAERQGIPVEELKTGWNEERESNEWELNYKHSLQQDVEEDIKGMLQIFELHRAAMEKGDLVTAKGALIHAAVFAQMLSGTFLNIHDECYKVLRDDERFSWPEIPEDYVVPEHYNYKGPK